MSGSQLIAAYTVVYPSAIPYFKDFFRGIAAQSDDQFVLYVSGHGIAKAEVERVVGAKIVSTWLEAPITATPAAVRNHALRHISLSHEAVVCIDCDDVPYSDRIANARSAMEASDVVASAMDIVAANGDYTGLVFAPNISFDPLRHLLAANVFGLSNTVYRSRVLQEVLPAPEDCVLVDWYMATKAYLAGYTLSFDLRTDMAYRQHATNTARILSPFDVKYLRASTDLVLSHYRSMLREPLASAQRELLTTPFRTVEMFARGIASDSNAATYADAISKHQTHYLWWEFLAHDDLKELWNKSI